MTSGAETVVYNILAATSAVTSLVPSTRITPIKMKQNSTLPAISYYRTEGPRIYSLTGPSGYAHPIVQIDIWGRTYPEVKNITEKVRIALSGYRGVVSGVTVQAIIFLGDQDIVDDQESVLPNEIFHVRTEFKVHHNEDEV